MSKSGFTIATALILLFVLAAYCPAEYSGGLGTAAEPYEIDAVADWQDLMDTPADWDKHFILTADVDLEGVPLSPVGNDANKFTGIFDGNDHIIGNADINMPDSDYVGLFGYVGQNGHVANLGGENLTMKGRNCVGGLMGGNHGGAISNCYSSASVNGTGDYVGGLVGRHFGPINNCYSNGYVGATGDYVGGLAGENGGIITNCYSLCSVAGNEYVGGLTGYNWTAISNCYSAGLVSGNKAVGGLVGHNNGRSGGGTITNSVWDVNTSGWATSAGGTGKTTDEMQQISTFLDAGWDFLGETANGTCNFWQMPDSPDYPVLSTRNGYIPAEPPGRGTEADPYIITDANELGTVWYRPSSRYVMANDIDLARTSWSGAVVPFFSGIFDGNDHALHNMDVNVPAADYVGLFGYLRRNGQIKNLGAEDISIFGRAHVAGLVCFNWGGTIGKCYSTGSISGWGRGGVGGLVGHNHRSSSVWDSHSIASVSGTGGYAGGLVGSNGVGATITNCYSTGTVNGNAGLVGYNAGTVTNCYSTGSVAGGSHVGGIVGWNYEGIIRNSYSTGSVSGSGYPGGLVGDNYRGSVSGSFWDVNTSGLATSDGGTPKTTAEMKAESTFTSAGWDLVGESANGTEDIWSICEGTNYPRLVWQIPQADWICPDGVGFEDFSDLANMWGTSDGGVYLDDEDGVGFGDLMVFCEQWLGGR